MNDWIARLPSVINVYLAGKIKKGPHWRDQLYARHVHHDVPSPDPFSDYDDYPWRIQEGVLRGGHNLTGPYFISCDHGCYHGANSHGVGGSVGGCYGDSRSRGLHGNRDHDRQRLVIAACLAAIKESTLVFAWLDEEHTTAYGTLVEIGYAAGIGIPVVVGTTVDQDPFTGTLSDTWFAESLATAICSKPSAGEAWDEFLRLIVASRKAMPYTDYLQTDHWQRVSAEAKAHADYRCQVCNASNVQLHTHHRSYARRGAESPSDLTVLCSKCHRLFHENGKLAKT